MKKKKKSSGYGLVKERIFILIGYIAAAREVIDFLNSSFDLAEKILPFINMACNYLTRTKWFDVRAKMANQI